MSNKANKTTENVNESMPMTKYIDLISKPTETVEKEILELEVANAKNTLEQGILTVKSALLAKQGEVLKAQTEVKTSQNAVSDALCARPFNVQSIVNSRRAIEKAESQLASRQAEYAIIEGDIKYLESLRLMF